MRIGCTDDSVWPVLVKLTETYAPLPADQGLGDDHHYEFRRLAEPPTRHALWRDGHWLGASERSEDLPPRFELDLYEQVLSGTRGLALHAAALCDERGRAMALLGPSGAGKSTLALAMVKRGWRYLSDEYVFLRPDGTVVALTRPIALKGVALGASEGFAYGLRAAGGEMLVARLVAPIDSLWHRPASLTTIVCLSHAPFDRLCVQRLTRAEGVLSLWRGAWRRSGAGLDAAAAVAAQIPVFTVHSGSVDDACRGLYALWGELTDGCARAPRRSSGP